MKIGQFAKVLLVAVILVQIPVFYPQHDIVLSQSINCGSQLFFESKVQGEDVGLWKVVDIESEELRNLTNPAPVSSFVIEWLGVDSTEIVVNIFYNYQYSFLALIDTDSGSIHNITVPINSIMDFLITVSPDQRLVLFNSTRDNNDSLHYFMITTGDIGIVEDEWLPWFRWSWSPDKTKIIYANFEGTENPNINNTYLVILDIETLQIRSITDESHGITHENYPYPKWSPDGTQVAFESWINGSYEIFLIDIDGSNMRQITDSPENNVNPIWIPCPSE